MALKRLKKIAVKPDQAYFCEYEKDGVVLESRITKWEYENLRQPKRDIITGEITEKSVADQIIDDGGILTGGYSRMDYETPTGLLGDNEYGDDLNGHVQIKDSRSPVSFTIESSKVVNDEVEDDTELREKLRDLEGRVIKL